MANQITLTTCVKIVNLAILTLGLHNLFQVQKLNFFIVVIMRQDCLLISDRKPINFLRIVAKIAGGN